MESSMVNKEDINSKHKSELPLSEGLVFSIFTDKNKNYGDIAVAITCVLSLIFIIFFVLIPERDMEVKKLKVNEKVTFNLEEKKI